MQESVIYQDFVAQGLEQGIRQGTLELLLHLLENKLGKINSEEKTRITELSVEQMLDLGEAMLDFDERDDLLVWLDNNQPF